jgi:hypothetical protein
MKLIGWFSHCCLRSCIIDIATAAAATAAVIVFMIVILIYIHTAMAFPTR